MEEDNENLKDNENIQNTIEENKDSEIEKIETEEINETEKIEETNNNTEDKEIVEEEKQQDDVEIENEEVKEETNEPIEKSKKWFLIIPIIVVIILFISTIFAILNIDNNNIVNGVYIEKLNISNLTKEDATSMVEEKLKQLDDIELVYNDYSTIIKLEELGITVDAKDAINKAINIGKSNNIIIDNYAILKTNIFKKKLELNILIDEEKFNEMTTNILAEMPGAVKQYSYEINDDKLIITKGTSGKSIDEKKLKELIIKNLKKQFNNEKEKENIPVIDSIPENIDISKIYNEIYKEAKDAYIVEEPFELHKDEDGIDFDISIDEAKKMLETDNETYTIPLKITKAKVKVKDLGDKLFKQTLSKYTTIYDAGNSNRAHNIALAASTINGTVLLPGESFSYNGTLGNTTKEKGYKEGGAYVGGKVVQAYGGGICQVSTTLYNAVLYANLEIVERHNHSYAVSYVPAGRDATVAYGGKDFKFKNNRNYPIKIVANAKNGVVSISIAGVKEEKEYEVVLSSSVLSTTPCQTVYEKNSSLAEGKEKVIQKGHSGLKSVAYKTIKYNGTVISKTVLSKDTYKPMDRIVQVVTKKTASSTPAETVPASTVENNNTSTEIISE